MSRKTTILARGTGILLLIVAFFPQSHSFYTLLRFLIAGIAGYMGIAATNQKQIGWTFIFAAIAGIFAPGLSDRIFLEVFYWKAVDVVSILIFIYSYLVF
jgi:hypothetical protein